jgi:hypothetical protein
VTTRRMAAAILVAFVVSEILAVLVHGFVLAADYGPYYGSLLRSQSGPAPQMLLLPVAHFSFIAALVWVFSRVDFAGGTLSRGLKLGIVGWLMGQAPLWLLWYAEQPWPGALVVKQLSLELASSLLIGLTIAAIGARPGRQLIRI